MACPQFEDVAKKCRCSAKGDGGMFSCVLNALFPRGELCRPYPHKHIDVCAEEPGGVQYVFHSFPVLNLAGAVSCRG